MRTLGHRVLRGVIAAALGTSAWAQQNPGLTTQPSGRTLAEPDAPPAEQPVDLSRPERRPPTLEVTTEEQAFFEAATRGEAWAQTRLGKLYVESPGDEQRLGQGVTLLQQAAAQNDPEAIYLLASVTAAGHGVAPSDYDAFEQMKRAAELGWREAQFALGTMYFAGRGTGQDEAAALESFRQAANQGHTEAMFSAGRILLSKSDPEQRREGLGLMGRAIDNGHIEATLMLATAYGRGSNGMPKDESQADAILQPGAERGNADCQFALASLYKFGDSFAARRDEAQMWLQRAADQGHPKALEVLRSGER
jgi:TPR repeat protein